MPTPATIVAGLLEGNKAMQNELKRLFKPGTRWNRVNYSHPSKMIDPTTHQPYQVPAGEAVRVMVVGARADGIVFLLPSAEQSHLTWPDDGLCWFERVGNSVEIHNARGRLLSYTPV